MFFGDVIVAILLGVLFAVLFGVSFGRTSGAPGFFFVFLLLFLFAWAGGLWLEPFGPALLGIYWLPGLIVTVLIFLLLAALATSRPPETTAEAKAELEARQTTAAALGIFFWVLIIGLVVSILVAYLV
ncbi:MAG: hypothetical protein ACLFP4_15735 [Spirochaetales bacterium]